MNLDNNDIQEQQQYPDLNTSHLRTKSEYKAYQLLFFTSAASITKENQCLFILYHLMFMFMSSSSWVQNDAAKWAHVLELYVFCFFYWPLSFYSWANWKCP